MSPDEEQELHEDLDVLNAPSLADDLPKAETPQFEVHEDNWPIVMAFLSVQTQWRFASGGLGAARTGLDYAAVWPVLHECYPEGDRSELFAGLQIMEYAALRTEAKMRAKVKQ